MSMLGRIKSHVVRCETCEGDDYCKEAKQILRNNRDNSSYNSYGYKNR